MQTVNKRDVTSRFTGLFQENVPGNPAGKNIEICLEPGKESVTIFHDFKNEKVIHSLVEYFSNIFRENGTPFVTSSYSSMIVFRFYEEHGPEDSSGIYGVEEYTEPDFTSGE